MPLKRRRGEDPLGAKRAGGKVEGRGSEDQSENTPKIEEKRKKYEDILEEKNRIF